MSCFIMGCVGFVDVDGDGANLVKLRISLGNAGAHRTLRIILPGLTIMGVMRLVRRWETRVLVEGG